MAFEKQLDMNFSLFLFRAVDRKIFGFEFPPANISAIFSATILVISFFFLKKSIYSYFKHSTILLFGFGATILHFFLNSSGCYLGILLGAKVYLIFPVISLTFLALADIFIVPRMYSLCRTTPESIKSFSSSLMMLCHGSGFYIAGFLAQFAAIKNDLPGGQEKDLLSFNSEILNVYFSSFGIFMILNIGLFISIFLLSRFKIGLLLSRK
jgi:hypothetical protein